MVVHVPLDSVVLNATMVVVEDSMEQVVYKHVIANVKTYVIDSQGHVPWVVLQDGWVPHVKVGVQMVLGEITVIKLAIVNMMLLVIQKLVPVHKIYVHTHTLVVTVRLIPWTNVNPPPVKMAVHVWIKYSCMNVNVLKERMVITVKQILTIARVPLA